MTWLAPARDLESGTVWNGKQAGTGTVACVLEEALQHRNFLCVRNTLKTLRVVGVTRYFPRYK